MNMKENYENLVVEVMSVETEKGYCASTVDQVNSVGVRRMGVVSSSDYSYTTTGL